MSFCEQPFTRIEINSNGDVYTCCPFFINFQSLGNIYELPFDEIWNGEIARNIRKKIIQGDLSFCSNLCFRKNKTQQNSSQFEEIVNNYPQEILISTSKCCNVRCIFCRDSETISSKENDNFDKIKDIFLPIFKDAKLVHFGYDGDPFSNKRECELIKTLAEKYPNIRFNFNSNGVIANEKFLKNLNVYDKIDSMIVSIHATNRWTYNKIVKGSNWNKVLSNLNCYSEMKKQNLIKKFRLIFVVFSENYKEMPKFVRLAQKLGAEADLWTLKKNDQTKVTGEDFEKYSIINPKHKHFKDLKRVLQDPIFDSQNILLAPELKDLREQNNEFSYKSYNYI